MTHPHPDSTSSDTRPATLTESGLLEIIERQTRNFRAATRPETKLEVVRILLTAVEQLETSVERSIS